MAFVSLHTSMYTWVCIYKFVPTSLYIKNSTYEPVHTSLYIHICTHKLVRKSVPTSLHTQMCMYGPVHTSLYIQICTYEPWWFMYYKAGYFIKNSQFSSLEPWKLRIHTTYRNTCCNAWNLFLVLISMVLSMKMRLLYCVVTITNPGPGFCTRHAVYYFPCACHRKCKFYVFELKYVQA